ncbi:unnamed protein product [marine sediment metagenome]|uniref:Uncharacterized protein n=1 Tax=marine sediment metagenome TaxID=412755 RepID=X0X4A9_9ZZZZ
MKQYTIYFSIFRKKMKTTVLARNESEAKQEIAKKIIFHKIKEVPATNPISDFLFGFGKT